jgi:hypothetical protein
MGEPLEGGGLIGPPPIGDPAPWAWDSVGAGAPPPAPPADPTCGRAAPSVGASATATAESSFFEQPVRTAGSTIKAAAGPHRKQARQSHQRMSFTFRQLHQDPRGVRQVAKRREKGAMDRCLLFANSASCRVFSKIDVAYASGNDFQPLPGKKQLAFPKGHGREPAPLLKAEHWEGLPPA